MCNHKTCKHCMEIIEGKEHKCDPDKVKTVKLLKKDTKPCPNCGEMIMKIDGCDQMWCPSCKNAWSWKSGTIVYGRIHNPHYYQYLRETSKNGEIRREEGDTGLCGNLPTDHMWMIRVCRSRYPDMIKTHHKQTRSLFNYLLPNLFRHYFHFRQVHYQFLQNQTRSLEQDKKMKILYMVNTLEEKEFKKHCQQTNKKIEINKAILDVYQLYIDVMRDKILQIYQIPRERDNITQKETKQIRKCLKDIQQIISYCHKELHKISYLYKCSIYVVTWSQYGPDISKCRVTTKTQYNKFVTINT